MPQRFRIAAVPATSERCAAPGSCIQPGAAQCSEVARSVIDGGKTKASPPSITDLASNCNLVRNSPLLQTFFRGLAGGSGAAPMPPRAARTEGEDSTSVGDNGATGPRSSTTADQQRLVSRKPGEARGEGQQASSATTDPFDRSMIETRTTSQRDEQSARSRYRTLRKARHAAKGRGCSGTGSSPRDGDCFLRPSCPRDKDAQDAHPHPEDCWDEDTSTPRLLPPPPRRNRGQHKNVRRDGRRDSRDDAGDSRVGTATSIATSASTLRGPPTSTAGDSASTLEQSVTIPTMISLELEETGAPSTSMSLLSVSELLEAQQTTDDHRESFSRPSHKSCSDGGRAREDEISGLRAGSHLLPLEGRQVVVTAWPLRTSNGPLVAVLDPRKMKRFYAEIARALLKESDWPEEEYRLRLLHPPRDSADGEEVMLATEESLRAAMLLAVASQENCHAASVAPGNDIDATHDPRPPRPPQDNWVVGDHVCTVVAPTSAHPSTAGQHCEQERHVSLLFAAERTVDTILVDSNSPTAPVDFVGEVVGCLKTQAATVQKGGRQDVLVLSLKQLLRDRARAANLPEGMKLVDPATAKFPKGMELRWGSSASGVPARGPELGAFSDVLLAAGFSVVKFRGREIILQQLMDDLASAELHVGLSSSGVPLEGRVFHPPAPGTTAPAQDEVAVAVVPGAGGVLVEQEVGGPSAHPSALFVERRANAADMELAMGKPTSRVVVGVVAGVDHIHVEVDVESVDGVGVVFRWLQ